MGLGPDLPIACRLCGAVYSTGIGGEPGAKILIGPRGGLAEQPGLQLDSAQSRCPKCGSWNTMPDGLYEFLDEAAAALEQVETEHLQQLAAALMVFGGPGVNIQADAAALLDALTQHVPALAVAAQTWVQAHGSYVILLGSFLYAMARLMYLRRQANSDKRRELRELAREKREEAKEKRELEAAATSAAPVNALPAAPSRDETIAEAIRTALAERSKPPPDPETAAATPAVEVSVAGAARADEAEISAPAAPAAPAAPLEPGATTPPVPGRRLQRLVVNTTTGAASTYRLGNIFASAFFLGDLTAAETDFFLAGADPPEDSPYPALTGNFFDHEGKHLCRVVRNVLTVNSQQCRKVIADTLGYEVQDASGGCVLRVSIAVGHVPGRDGKTVVATVGGRFFDKTGTVAVDIREDSLHQATGSKAMIGYTPQTESSQPVVALVKDVVPTDMRLAGEFFRRRGAVYEVMQGTYVDKTISLDGKYFMGVRFHRCTLVATSTNFCVLDGSEFWLEECTLQLAGEAARMSELFDAFRQRFPLDKKPTA